MPIDVPPDISQAPPSLSGEHHQGRASVLFGFEPVSARLSTGPGFQPIDFMAAPFKGPLPLRSQNAQMSDGMTRDEFQAHLGRISAETDTKIAKMDGKLDQVILKLDNVISSNTETRSVIREEQRATRGNVWVVGVGLAAIVIAMAVAFPTFFGIGVQMKDIAAQTTREILHPH